MSKSKIENFAVITGASKGLGKAIARACAQRHIPLILIALPNEELAQFASELKALYSIEVVFFEADLTQKEEVERITEQINAHYRVQLLINNAGIGGSVPFRNSSIQYIENILLLNIRALVLLTHGLLDNLKQSAPSYILNIASMASFGPMPYKTVYPASKAFVYSFSRGLNEELKHTGVVVCVAHPGGMATNSDVTERINRYNRLIRSTILSPEKTAEICIRQLLKNNSLIIPGFMNKVSWLFLKLIPVWIRLIIFRKSVLKEFNTFKRIEYGIQ